MARKPGKTYPSDGPRWFKLKSQGIAEDTAELTDAQFRAMILILARQNENGSRGDGGVVYIARTELIGVAPNRRNSTATATRVIRELCASMTWRVHESDAKWTIWTEKPEQNQDFDPATKTKTKTKTKNTPQTPLTGGPESTPSKPSESKTQKAARRGKSNGKRIDPRAIEAWPAIREAFERHGKILDPQVGHDRAELIVKRIDEGATPADLAAAVDGYVSIHKGLEADERFDPAKYFQPSTIFKATGFSDRVDAGKQPRRVSSKNRLAVLKAQTPNMR